MASPFRSAKIHQYWVLSDSDRLPTRGTIKVVADFNLTGHRLPRRQDSLWMHEFKKHRQVLESNDRLGALRALAATVFDDKAPFLSRVAAYKTMDQVVQLAGANDNRDTSLIAALRDQIDGQAILKAESDASLNRVLHSAQFDLDYPW